MAKYGGNVNIEYVHGFDHGYILKNNCNGTEKFILIEEGIKFCSFLI